MTPASQDARPVDDHSYYPQFVPAPPPEMTVGDALRRAVRIAPDRTGLVGFETDPARRWTFAELLSDAEPLAASLLHAFAPGDRVAVCSPNCAEVVLLQFAVALGGLTLVPLNPTLRDRELEYALGHSGASVAFVAAEHRDRGLAELVSSMARRLPLLREVVALPAQLVAWRSRAVGSTLSDVEPGALGQIQYTSGTTGLPKGVLITHRGMTTTAAAFTSRLARPAGGVWINPMPLFHTAGNVLGALGACWQVATHVVLPFKPSRVVEAIVSERADVLSAAPTLLHALVDEFHPQALDLPTLEVVFTGGSTLEPAFVRRVEASFGARLSVIFGMTETCGAALVTSPQDGPTDRQTTAGRPLPYTEIKIVDTESQEIVRCGERGELCVRGARITTGYHDRADETARTIDTDGWLHTGDQASMDDRGYCRIEGRLKELIKSGGENIAPSEIESCLLEHPAVSQTAVVGLPDERWGEIVTAFVVPVGERTPTLAAELLEHCRGTLAPFKLPRRWAFVDELPVTASGKVQRVVLRDRAIGAPDQLERT